MKILYVITGLGVGGAEKQTILIANRMFKAGHDIMIISLTGKAFVKPNKGIDLKNLEIKKNIFSLVNGLFKVKKIIKSFEPDIVHSHMYHANIFSRLSKLIVKIPVLICTAHNTNEGSIMRMLTYRWTDKLASLSTNVSKDAVNAFVRKKASSPNRMIVMPNGIDVSKFEFSLTDRVSKRQELNLTPDMPMLLSVGRLTEAKDYPNLLNAYSLLLKADSHQNVPLLFIVGSGELHSHLSSMTSQLGIEKYVRFLGLRDDIRELMCAADIFVLSSEWEGFPLVITEAMACEKLIVATDSGGINEALGEYGYIVPIKDSRSLFKAISKVLALPESEKVELGLAAKNRVTENYSIDIIVKSWLDLYNNLLSRTRKTNN
ncbi:glycosyltransferase [Yersinia mollaretii]|uniref:glycosyltransferase n=1 Tax=Yersinia mollaretii TaxID=33060 RepID=UPI0005DDCD48|nr:glycosyltransferase [Yersinia mollaretii]MDN0111189.1 glycosyltransferase [Yersinia mollaretii]PJE89563.1 glycosyltransferase [Yersinia mollaretii]CQD44317.1 WbcN protein [Yersinia mollaretii]CQH00830.1 WbcN protein [Yersinia mollaretii]